MKHVTLDGGVRVGVFSRPPADLDPFAASDAELGRYGLPRIPALPAHQERYQGLFRQLRGKLNFVEPTFRLHPGRVPRPGLGGLLGGPPAFASADHAGALVSAPQGDSIHWMQADWIVPNVTAPTLDNEYFFASWIGIGGPGGGAFQAGVHFTISRSRREIYPFWEWLDQGNGHILDVTNFPVRAGDLISVILCTEQGAGSTSGTVYFFNRTTGSHTAVAVGGPAMTASTAEWGVGFPAFWGGDASLLGDYGEIFFDQCEAVTNGAILIGSGSGSNINLTSDGTANGTVISESRQITDTIVQSLYRGAAP